MALLAAWDINDRVNQYLISNLDAGAWRAEPPGGKGRTIAAIVAHIHNVRLLWIRAAAKDLAPPAKLDGETCTAQQSREALAGSAAIMRQVLEGSLATDGRIKNFKPDVMSFAAYLFAHEGHHRGQITMLARQTGFPVSKSVNFGLWEWGTR